MTDAEVTAAAAPEPSERELRALVRAAFNTASPRRLSFIGQRVNARPSDGKERHDHRAAP